MRIDNIIKSAIMWDVMGGVARRAWARNPNAMETCKEYNHNYRDAAQITIPCIADEDLIRDTVKKAFENR